jgi:cytochrome bd-type quinol oxidase subunit 2
MKKITCELYSIAHTKMPCIPRQNWNIAYCVLSFLYAVIGVIISVVVAKDNDTHARWLEVYSITTLVGSVLMVLVYVSCGKSPLSYDANGEREKEIARFLAGFLTLVIFGINVYGLVTLCTDISNSASYITSGVIVATAFIYLLLRLTPSSSAPLVLEPPAPGAANQNADAREPV